MTRSAESDEEEAALAAAWRAGDDGAGEVLFERYFDMVYGFFASKISSDVNDKIGASQRTMDSAM